MATVMTHAFVGAAMVLGVRNSFPKELLRPLAFYAAVMAMVPDLDVLAFTFGIPYEAPLGHRGFSHSLVFAGFAAILATWLLRWRSGVGISSHRKGYLTACLLLFLAVASHPLLDMLTDGGLGCALFAPFSWDRHFFPITPIPVSPIGLHQNVLLVWMWELAIVWPAFCALMCQAFTDKKSLKMTALVCGLLGNTAAIWARRWYYGIS